MQISEHQSLPLAKEVCKRIPLKENLSWKVDSASHFRMYSLYTFAVQCAVSEPPASVAHGTYQKGWNRQPTSRETQSAFEQDVLVKPKHRDFGRAVESLIKLCLIKLLREEQLRHLL